MELINRGAVSFPNEYESENYHPDVVSLQKHTTTVSPSHSRTHHHAHRN